MIWKGISKDYFEMNTTTQKLYSQCCQPLKSILVQKKIRNISMEFKSFNISKACLDLLYCIATSQQHIWTSVANHIDFPEKKRQKTWKRYEYDYMKIWIWLLKGLFWFGPLLPKLMKRFWMVLNAAESWCNWKMIMGQSL